MQDMKGTAVPVPAADATTDAVERNGVPACALEAGGASTPVRRSRSQICRHLAALFKLHSAAAMSELQNQNG